VAVEAYLRKAEKTAMVWRALVDVASPPVSSGRMRCEVGQGRGCVVGNRRMYAAKVSKEVARRE
jgi:hypothetical protein